MQYACVTGARGGEDDSETDRDRGDEKRAGVEERARFGSAESDSDGESAGAGGGRGAMLWTRFGLHGTFRAAAEEVRRAGIGESYCEGEVSKGEVRR